MTWRIPLFEPDFGPAELEAVQQPLRDKWLTMGEMTALFEREFAQRCGVKHAIAVTNCTAGLHLALAGADIGPGDEVICPTLTFVATANAIRYVGATPVLCESIGPQNLNIGPDQIGECITPRTRGVIAVHYAGFPVDMPGVLEIAAHHNLVVIEDCAHALFSMLQGRVCGSWGNAAAFSFFSNKNMTCGEGGMVTTNDDEIARRVRLMRSHGMTTLTLDRHRGRAMSYDVLALGYNYRLDEIRSALGLVQLRRLDGFLRDRERVYREYCVRLQDSSVILPTFDREMLTRPGDSVAYHIMSVLLPEGIERSRVADALREQGIQSSVHYPPVHTFTAFANCGASALPRRTEQWAHRQLTLPFFPAMTPNEVDLVCTSLLTSIGGRS